MKKNSLESIYQTLLNENNVIEIDNFSRDIVKQKLRLYFDGKIVKKSLTKK